MSISQEFMNVVKSGNVLRTRIMLKNSMMVDPSLTDFNQMLEFASKNMVDLFDEHDNELFSYNREEWNVDYMNQQMVNLISNFSSDRIDLLKKVVQFVYKDKINNLNRTKKIENDNEISGKKVGAGVAVAGTAIAVGGLIAESGAIVVLGTVAAVAGIAMVVLSED